LREDCDFVVKGTIAEVEDDTGCNAIALDDLRDVARGDGSPLDCFEDKEAVRGALGMAYWDRLPIQGSDDEYGDERAEDNAH
jgi:hypothetical protein